MPYIDAEKNSKAEKHLISPDRLFFIDSIYIPLLKRNHFLTKSNKSFIAFIIPFDPTLMLLVMHRFCTSNCTIVKNSLTVVVSMLRNQSFCLQIQNEVPLRKNPQILRRGGTDCRNFRDYESCEYFL